MISLPPPLLIPQLYFLLHCTNPLPINLDSQRRCSLPHGKIIMTIPEKKVKFLAFGFQKSRFKCKMKMIRKSMKRSRTIVPYHISFPSPTHPLSHTHIPPKNRPKLPDRSKGNKERQWGYVHREQ